MDLSGTVSRQLKAKRASGGTAIEFRGRTFSRNFIGRTAERLEACAAAAGPWDTIPIGLIAADEPEPARHLSSEGLDAFARQKLLAYQAPVRTAIYPALPRAESMKVDLGALRALLSSS